jgi:hypothetical protein
MFEFIARDDGYLVRNGGGRSVADVRTTEITFDERLKDPKPQRNVLPREKWLVHFCGVRLGLDELQTFLDELARQNPGA